VDNPEVTQTETSLKNCHSKVKELLRPQEDEHRKQKKIKMRLHRKWFNANLAKHLSSKRKVHANVSLVTGSLKIKLTENHLKS